MRVSTAQGIDVHRHLSVVDEALEKLEKQVDIEFSDSRPRKFNVVLETWAA